MAALIIAATSALGAQSVHASTVTAISDSMSRTVASGWGSAGAAGSYALDENASFSVDGSKGWVSVAPGADRNAELAFEGPDDSASSIVLEFSTLPQSGSVRVGLGSRVVGTKMYSAQVKIDRSGDGYLGWYHVPAPGSKTLLGAVEKLPFKVLAGKQYVLGTEVEGAGTVRLRARMWAASVTRPSDWSVDATDASSSRIDDPGGIAVWTYLSGSERTPLKLSVDDVTLGEIPSTQLVTAAPRPSASSTGVPAGTSLKRVDGDLVVTESGAHLDALDVRGFVWVKAPNVVITRSIIRGRPGISTSHGLLKVDHPAARNVVIEDSELRPSSASPWVDGIHGNNFTARRVEIAGTVDGVKIFGDNATISDSWIHDLAYFASDPQQGGKPSHNDGIQVQGGRNADITGNFIQVRRTDNAAMQVTQGWGVTSDMQFARNWVAGGMCHVNLSNKPRGPMQRIRIEGNIFSRDTWIPRCAVIQTAVPLVFSGNTWADGGLPLPGIFEHADW